MKKPAIRVTDQHICPAQTPGTPPIPHVGGLVTGPGSATVKIAGLPATMMGDVTQCIGPPGAIVAGSPTVFIEGRNAARVGDPVSHGGQLLKGCLTVTIGDSSVAAPAPLQAPPAAGESPAPAESGGDDDEAADPEAAEGERAGSGAARAGTPALTWVGIRVVDADTGAPYPGIVVELDGPSHRRVLGTNLHGYAEARQLEPGEYRLHEALERRTSLDDTVGVEEVRVGDNGSVPAAEAPADAAPSGSANPIATLADEAGRAATGQQWPDLFDRMGHDELGARPRWLARLVEHHPAEHETGAGIAREAGLAWRRIADFNFGPEDPAEQPERGRYQLGGGDWSTPNDPLFDREATASLWLPEAWRSDRLTMERINEIRVRRHRRVGWVDFALVDELGHPIAGAALELRGVDGVIHAVSTDRDGYARVDRVPWGIVAVRMNDRRPVYYQRDGELVPASLHTAHALNSATRLVLLNQVPPAALAERDEEREIYQPVARRPTPLNARRGQAGPTTDPAEPPPTVRPRRSGIAVDNLALVQPLEGEQFDDRALLADLGEWLADYYPQVMRRGYVVGLLRQRELTIYEGERELGRFPVNRPFRAALGGYAPVEDRTNAPFRDLSFRRFTIAPSQQEGLLEGVAEGNGHQDLYVDELSPRGAELRAVLERYRNRVLVLYRAPDSMAFARAVAAYGGCGVLEPYGRNQRISDRAHRRNLGVVRNVGAACQAEIDAWIRQLDLLGSEAEIRAHGPPPPAFRFPTPIGLRPGSARARELIEAGAVNEYDAWRALVRRLNLLANVHGEGEAWIRVNVEYEYSDPDRESGGEHFYRPFIGDHDTVKVTRNFDVGTDGTRVSVEERQVSFRGYQLRGGPLGDAGMGETIERDPATGRVMSRESQLSAAGEGAVRWSDHGAGFEIGEVEASLNDDGEMSFGYEGHTVTHNARTGENSVDLASLEIPWLGEITLQWCWNMNSLETLERILSNGPGFFDTRSWEELSAPTTQWNDLCLDEHLRLQALGWIQSTWDRKHRMALSEFPRACRVSRRDLRPVERRAALQLWIPVEDWPMMWRSVCRQPPDVEPPPA